MSTPVSLLLAQLIRSFAAHTISLSKLIKNFFFRGNIPNISILARNEKIQGGSSGPSHSPSGTSKLVRTSKLIHLTVRLMPPSQDEASYATPDFVVLGD
jgi:hypothetical protein